MYIIPTKMNFKKKKELYDFVYKRDKERNIIYNNITIKQQLCF